MLSHNHRTYYVKDIRHEIPSTISFSNQDDEFAYNKKTTDALYDHIRFTIDVLEKYIPGKYCAVSGTLLGCIRHQGIIPWDSDADFLVMKHDLLFLRTCIKSINKIHKHYTFAFIELFGAIKVYYKGHCFIDIFGFDFLNSKKNAKTKNNKIAYYGPEVHGENTFAVNSTFPTEVYNYHDIFPVIKRKFEDFEIYCPRKSKKVLLQTYSPKALHQIVFPQYLHAYIHEDFFNSIDTLWFFNKLYKYCCDYQIGMKYTLQYLLAIISYSSSYTYLSNQQKNEFLVNYLDNFVLEDFLEGYILRDLLLFHIHQEPKKLMDEIIRKLRRKIFQ